jgi:hypothetical protein
VLLLSLAVLLFLLLPLSWWLVLLLLSLAVLLFLLQLLWLQVPLLLCQGLLLLPLLVLWCQGLLLLPLLLLWCRVLQLSHLALLSSSLLALLSWSSVETFDPQVVIEVGSHLPASSAWKHGVGSPASASPARPQEHIGETR